MPFDKKQLEVLLMNYFRDNYTEFPRGKISASESPDFVLKMKNRHTLGIELTRLNPANKFIPNNQQFEQIRIREEIIEKAQNLFAQNSDLKLFVKFLFTESKEIKKESQIITSVRIVNAIRNGLQNKNRNGYFKETLSRKNLPYGVEEILLINHPEMQNSIWERANNLGVSNDVVDDIRQAILKKDVKLKLYQKQRLNYYWLLIFTDRLRGVKNFNLVNKIINHHFKSQFQRVFLFDLIKSDIYRLI